MWGELEACCSRCNPPSEGGGLENDPTICHKEPNLRQSCVERTILNN